MNRHVFWAIVIAAALLYPVVVLAGGTPRFPNRGECVHPAEEDGDLEAVFGRYAERGEATAALRHVLEVGFKGSEIEGDGCGFFKVAVHGIPTIAVGRDLLAEARTVGIHATLENAEP
jgi:hypothetical protein